MKKKIYAITIRVIIGFVVFWLGYFGAITFYFYSQQFFLGYTYRSIEEDFNETFPNGVEERELQDIADSL